MSPLCFGIGLMRREGTSPSEKPLTGSKRGPSWTPNQPDRPYRKGGPPFGVGRDPAGLLLHHITNLMDNLNIKGIRENEPPARRGKKSRGRKLFAIESRLVHDPDAPKRLVSRQLGLGKWWVWSRYETALRRDQAYAALVRKESDSNLPRWARWEFRKRDD